MLRRPSFFYGWVIVAIVAVSMVLVYGIRNSFSVFFPSILDEFGWGRGSTAVMLSLNLGVYGLLAPLAGSLGDRWNPRRVMSIGIVVLGLATAACAFARELWHFYLLFGIVMPLGNAFAGWPLLGPALVNWFVKHRGLVIGLGQMGGGLSFAYGLFAEFTISQVGWRYAYAVLAGILVATLLPLYAFFFHYRPGSKGVEAFGAELQTASGSAAYPPAVESSPSRDWTMGEAMRTYHLWLLMLSQLFFWGIGCYLVLGHQVRFAEDAGYSGVFAASIFALFGVFMFLGQVSGFISDTIGREATITLASILAIGAILALIAVTDTSRPWLLYVYATSFGYGTGLFSATTTAGAADIFHGRSFGGIAGLLLAGMGVGGAIGPWLGGYIYDISGSYLMAFALCLVAFLLAGVAFWMAAPRHAARIRARR